MKSKLRITTPIFFCLALAFQVDAAAGTRPADHPVRGTPTEARKARSERPVIENIGGGTIEEPKLLPGIDTGETSGASPSSDKADLEIPIQISDDALLASRIENGDPYAMYEFGVRILKSNPTEDQYAAAVGALLNAANLGHVESRALLGLMSMDPGASRKPPLPEKKAREWIRSAASEGVIEAMVYEGKSLVSARTVNPKDLERALLYLEFAGEKGDSAALATLGDLYFEGRHVSRDHGRAAKYYGECSRDAECRRSLRLGILARDGTALPRNLAWSFDLFTRAFREGDLSAHKELATAYLYGLGTQKNERMAFLHAEKAASTGDATSETLLCLMYLEGRGVKRSSVKAKEWCSKGAESGNERAKAILDSLRDK